jgi:Tol biopolymer transport system component
MSWERPMRRPTSLVEGYPPYLVGCTEYRADLPGGMHPYLTSQRACLARSDSSSRQQLAEELTREPSTWTSFAGWSPDGRLAIIASGWESLENAAWEEQHQTFRMTEGWRHDQCLLDLASGALINVTAVERVGNYNAGLFFWPNDPERLGFEALIGGISTPFSMSLDGTKKKDLSSGNREFTYGLNVSPDGSRIAYHKSYQVHIADADGNRAARVETGQPFNFCPRWSPDGQRLLFLSGEHYDCHPYIVRPDGAGLRKLADRQGYRGVVELLDVPAFHSASSDVPVWAPDGQSVYYTAKCGESVELMRVALDGTVQQLTRSEQGILNYHPKPSPDGAWVLFGSNRAGARQLHVIRADGAGCRPLTHVPTGYGAAHGHWQPVAPGP